MFSQRNNPYCDLLRLSGGEFGDKKQQNRLFLEDSYIWGMKNIKNVVL